MKINYSKTHCSHYVLSECSQKHHDNCVGTDKCIHDLELKIKQLKDAFILEQQLSEKAIVKYRQTLKYIMQNSTDETIIKICRETLGEN